jgi:hypothetical protein
MFGLGTKLGMILKNGLISAGSLLCLVMTKVRKSLKIVALAAVVLSALGAVAYVYACSQTGTTANAYDQMGIQNMQSFFGSQNVTMPWGHMRRIPQMRMNDLPWNEGLLQNATLSTVQGTVVSTVQGMLILEVGSGQVRILLPRGWTVSSEVVGRASLFNGTFASPGQTVTVKVLESNVFSNASFSINAMMGYEAINATGTHAYAVLPFNVQPNS